MPTKCNLCGEKVIWLDPILGCMTEGCTNSLSYKARHSTPPSIGFSRPFSNIVPVDEGEAVNQSFVRHVENSR